MHEEEIVAVVFQTDIVGNTCAHGNGAYTCITDKRVDLLIFRKEEIHQFHKQHTTGTGDDESHGTKDENLDGVEGEELTGLCGASHGETEQDHHDVVECASGSLSQARCLATLLPKNSMPSRGRPEGTRKVVSSRPMMGKRIRSVWLTWRVGFM